jgi:hypothetical protein
METGDKPVFIHYDAHSFRTRTPDGAYDQAIAAVAELSDASTLRDAIWDQTLEIIWILASHKLLALDLREAKRIPCHAFWLTASKPAGLRFFTMNARHFFMD